jgi:hypothetical protein
VQAYISRSSPPPPATRGILITLRALARFGLLTHDQHLHASTELSREANDALARRNTHQDAHIARLDGENRLADAKRARGSR